MQLALWRILFTLPVLFLLSCTNAVIELTSTSQGSVPVFKIDGNNTISQSPTPTLVLERPFLNARALKLVVYTISTCDNDVFKIAEMDNQLNASMRTSALAVGRHDFFYKAIYSTNTTPGALPDLTALCMPAALSYTFDNSAPPQLGLTLTSAATTVDRDIQLSVTGCENSDTGASSVLFIEGGPTPPLATAPGWEDCSSNRTFRISETWATKAVYAFAKDQAGNVSNASNSISVTLTAAPVISTTPENSTQSILEDIFNPITPITFSNSGGPVVSCTSEPALPSGLTVHVFDSFGPTTCQVSGVPNTVTPMTNYKIIAIGAAGPRSEIAISIEIKARPRALVTFAPGSAGPGTDLLTGASSSSLFYSTFLKATVSDAAGNATATHYTYGIISDPSATDCSTAFYVGEFPIATPLSKNLAYAEGPKRLCVKAGDKTTGIWQQLPTVYFWMQAPAVQDLIAGFTGVATKISMANLAAGSLVPTREFTVSTAVEKILCSSGPNDGSCSISINDGTPAGEQLYLNAGDKVKFYVATSSVAGGNFGYTILINNNLTVSISATTAPANCSIDFPENIEKIFLSRNTYTGSMGGISGADEKCNAEARILYNSTTITGWKALLSGTDSVLGLNQILGSARLSSVKQYCDVSTGNLGAQIFSVGNTNFQNSFFQFAGGGRVNGGGTTDWMFIPDAPRYQTGTTFWYGQPADCNCNDWTSNTTSATCNGASGTAAGYSLTFESSAPDQKPVPDNVGLCSQPRHLVCFHNPP